MHMNVANLAVLSYVCLQGLITLVVIIVASSTIFSIVKRSDKPLSAKSIVELWVKTIWKMRSIYASLIVHVFDFITDSLVIWEWSTIEQNKDVEHIDATVMTYSAISVLIFYRIISSIAIFVITNYDMKQALLQLFDLLLFLEIYYSHENLIEILANEHKQQIQKHGYSEAEHILTVIGGLYPYLNERQQVC